jgi:alpha-tubulin suppressor-like RCC1 family protein
MPSMPRLVVVVLSGLALLVSSAARPTAQVGAAAIAFGNRHAVALRTNGEVLTWGENVYCQLGRASRGNSGRTPAVVMRNATAIAAAADHTLVLAADGKVYGWGMNPEGALGTGNTNDQCEGPALVESLAAYTVTHIATGNGFSVAVTSDGDLYCSGDNSMGQCPIARAGRVEVFTKVPVPELAGAVADVRSGAFHTLIQTRNGALYALGRGRDGQLGSGTMVNGFAPVSGLTDVVSFAAGTWHSVAARADGTVWTWGNGTRSQLCDGATANRAQPASVALPAGVQVAQVAAGGHSTLLRTRDGALFGCGDNQFGALGIAAPAATQPTPIPAPPITSAVIAISGGNGAFSADGCAVSLSGSNDHGLVSTADTAGAKTFTARPDLTLCGPRPAAPLPTVVNPAPRGGVSNCWTARVEEDGSASPRFAGLRKAMLAGEALLKNNAAFLAAPQPVRLRTSLSAGPLDGAGARMHIKAVPERKSDGTRLWTTGCEVIPQIDRIGGAIAQVSIFVNHETRGHLISPVGEAPKRTGTAAGYPEFNGWVLITKDGRLPWLPQTLSDRLDEEGAKRDKALAEAKRRGPGVVPDAAAGGLQWLEKQVRDYQQYRASFTAAQLQEPGVWGDPTGAGRKRLEAEVAALRNLSVEDQQKADALGLESRTLERQAQAESRNKNVEEAARLRERSTALARDVRDIRQAHMARVTPLIIDAMASYDLTNLQPGPAERAMRAKPDPTFPNAATPNRVQVITVMLSFGPKPAGAQLDWQTKTIAAFDFSALAALLD